MDDCGLDSSFHRKVAALALQVKKPKFFCSIQGPKIKCQSSGLCSEPKDNCFWSFSQSFSIILSPAWHQCEETHSHFSWEPSTPRPHRVWKDYITTYSTLAASHRCCLESPAILLLPGLKHPSHYSQDSNNLSFSGCALRSCHPPPSSPQRDTHSDWVVITIALSSEASPRLSVQILLWKALRPWEPGKAWLLQERYLDLPHTTTH